MSLALLSITLTPSPSLLDNYGRNSKAAPREILSCIWPAMSRLAEISNPNLMRRQRPPVMPDAGTARESMLDDGVAFASTRFAVERMATRASHYISRNPESVQTDSSLDQILACDMVYVNTGLSGNHLHHEGRIDSGGVSTELKKSCKPTKKRLEGIIPARCAMLMSLQAHTWNRVTDKDKIT